MAHLATTAVGEFVRTDVFPIPPEEADGAFSSWFETPDHTHAELVAFAHNPGTGSTRCPLCRAPAYGSDCPSLEPTIVAAIRRDFAAWTPDAGLCQQCADLYGSRAGVPRVGPKS